MKKCFFAPTVLLALMLQASLLHSQQILVQTAPNKQSTLTRAVIEALPHAVIKTEISGTPVTFEGVALKSLLEKAGVEFGPFLKGKRLVSCVLVEAADGYRVVIALPEIDPGFTDKQIVLAFLEDGKPLDEKAGPYRLVIPDEKRMARWVRQVIGLKIVDVQ